MSTTKTPSQLAVYVRLEAFLQYILPSQTPVVQGLANRLPTPPGAYVVMTAILQKRLATNINRYDDPNIVPGDGTRAIQQNTRMDVQLDFYGPDASDWAAMAETLWRDEVGCSLLAPDCQPLYADSAMQVPLVTGEEQYQQRWTLTAALQYNPVTTNPQQFADAAVVDLINVDERYPPT